MNYRHAFHAGNHADVLKHVALLALLAALARKPAPFFVLDTHAGRGVYDLAGDEAARSGEAAAGVDRLDGARGDPALVRYLDALVRLRARHGERSYPGSPLWTADALRADDRLATCEWQPDEAAALRHLFADDPRVAVHRRDGYEAIGALLPPPQRRGLVLIDPPYEAQLDEFDAIVDALAVGLSRFPAGVYAVWYPIKRHADLAPFFRRIDALSHRQAWVAELCIRPPQAPLALNGSGMLVLNPPWQVDTELAPALDTLRDTLAPRDGSASLRWLRREADVSTAPRR